MKKTALVVGLASVLGFGCGGDDGPAAKPGKVNETSAKQSVQQTGELRAAAEAKNPATIQSVIAMMNATAQGIVQPQVGAASLDPPPVVLAAEAEGSSCTETGCTLKGAYEGTLSWTTAGDGKRITWDLKTSQTGAGAAVPNLSAFKYESKGDITVSATKVDGQLTVKATIATQAQGQSVTGGYESLVKYQAVTVASGVPNGGSLYAKWSSSGSNGGQSATQAYEGTITFGP